MKRLTQSEAIEQDFIIDNCCYPPLAYKGPRFNPTEKAYCLTELEEKMYWQLREYQAVLRDKHGRAYKHGFLYVAEGHLTNIKIIDEIFEEIGRNE